jgi:hypothetical protein
MKLLRLGAAKLLPCKLIFFSIPNKKILLYFGELMKAKLINYFNQLFLLRGAAF